MGGLSDTDIKGVSDVYMAGSVPKWIIDLNDPRIWLKYSELIELFTGPLVKELTALQYFQTEVSFFMFEFDSDDQEKTSPTTGNAPDPRLPGQPLVGGISDRRLPGQLLVRQISHMELRGNELFFLCDVSIVVGPSHLRENGDLRNAVGGMPVQV